MEDFVHYNELYDYYKDLLTEKQKQYFEDYFFHNLSFSEMAENYEVSRNAAFKQIHIVMDKLDEYEKILQLKAKKEKVLSIVEDCSDDVKKKIEDLL